MAQLKVIFVCLGNICRSPMAENVMRQLVREAGLEGKIEIDSAGTASYHIGKAPHPGTRAILAQNGIECVGRARQMTPADLMADDTWVIAMDASNRRNLERINGSHPHLHMLLDFADPAIVPADGDVPDPYYTGVFETVFKLVTSGCQGLLQKMSQTVKLAE